MNQEKDFNNIINSIAFEFEKVFHSTPSGLDNTSVINGGLIIFNRGINRMDKIDTKFFENYSIILIDSGIPKNTRITVEMIRNMNENHYSGKATKDILNTIGTVTSSIEELLLRFNESKDNEDIYDEFEKLIKMNHYLLQALSLANPQIVHIIQ